MSNCKDLVAKFLYSLNLKSYHNSCNKNFTQCIITIGRRGGVEEGEAKSQCFSSSVSNTANYNFNTSVINVTLWKLTEMT